MNLSVMKSVFPDFELANFDMFDRIIALKWETVFDSEFWEEHRNLTVEMTSPGGYKILIEFRDVVSFRFAGSGQIAGFYVEDMLGRGYENDARYKVGNYEYEEDGLRFYCSDVIVKHFEKTEM